MLKSVVYAISQSLVCIAGMQPGKAKGSAAVTLVQRAVPGELDQGQVLRLCKACPELVTLALLAAGKRIAELLGEPQGQHPSP